MLIELRIPPVGESITEVQINEWLKAEGDAVRKDEPIAVIDSEKTTFDLPAPEDGKLTRILHKAGDTVGVGDVIAHVGSADGSDEAGKPKQGAETKPAEEPDAKESPHDDLKADGHASSGQSPRIVTPEPRRISPDLGRKRDTAMPEKSPTEEKPRKIPVENTEAKMAVGAATTQPADVSSSEGEARAVPMSMLRRTIARRLVEARQTMAMLTTFNEVDMEVVQTLRRQHQEEFQKRHGAKLGLMSFFVKAAIEALKEFPQLNAEVRGNDILYRRNLDIGVAVATDRGLVVPTLRHAEHLGFAAIEKAVDEFARRARENTLEPEQLEGGTFTITNGGVFGSLLSTPIINPPQSGILGLHSIEDRPVARDKQVVIRPMMYLALTYDHRIVDGREAVLFLRRIKEAIESPVRMLIEA